MKLAPWVPWVLVVVVGLTLYGIGRLDGGASAEGAAVADARGMLALSRKHQAIQAELRAKVAARAPRIVSLTVVTNRQDDELDSLTRAAAHRATSADTGEIGALARDLRLSPTSDGWRADSATVRHLALLAWRSNVLLPVALRQVDSLQLLVTLQAAQILDLTEGWGDAARRVTDLERSLGNLLAVRECRLLAVLPCPSRSLSLAIGVAGGAVATFMAMSWLGR